MLINKPLPLLEAHLFLKLRVNGFTTEDFYNTIKKRYPNNSSEYEAAFETIMDIEKRLLIAIEVDMELLQSLYLPLSARDKKHSNVAQDGVADILVADMDCFVRSREGFDSFFGYLKEDNNAILNNIAAAIQPECSSNAWNMNSIFELVNECNWPQRSKFTLLDLAVNSEKYIDNLEKALVPIAHEFERCEPLWTPLIELYRTDYCGYETAEALVETKFPQVSCSCFSSFTAYPSITGYRQVFLSDEKHGCKNAGEFTIICGVLFETLRHISSLEQNSAAELSRIMSVLGDPSRFNIIFQLAKKPSYGRELAKLLSLTPGAISQHLSILMSTELVTSSVEGNRVYYALNKEKMREFLNAMLQIFPC